MHVSQTKNEVQHFAKNVENAAQCLPAVGEQLPTAVRRQPVPEQKEKGPIWPDG